MVMWIGVNHYNFVLFSLAQHNTIISPISHMRSVDIKWLNFFHEIENSNLIIFSMSKARENNHFDIFFRRLYIFNSFLMSQLVKTCDGVEKINEICDNSFFDFWTFEHAIWIRLWKKMEKKSPWSILKMCLMD